MATDAKFDLVQKIVPHDNADALEIAVVSNFPCVVKKGSFKEGDVVFYIRDDAKLVEYDHWKDFMSRYGDPCAFITQDGYCPEKFTWQEPLLKYLGGGGRVKTIKLRGRTSMGILMKPSDIGLGSGLTWEGAKKINAKILDPETGSAFLEREFGVAHWSAPIGNVGTLDVLHAGLECGVQPSDEENWENLSEDDLHLGAKCLVTKKLDGTSCTIICWPSGKHAICSRNNTFNVTKMMEDGTENVYTKFTQEAVKAGLWWAKTHGKIIALRGEVCCSSVQRFGFNKDKELNNFFLYRVELPEEEDWFKKHGVYGSGVHFVQIAGEMNSNGFNVKTVPIVGEDVVSRELLQKYNDMPYSWGEGVVLNIDCSSRDPEKFSTTWSCKAKSREYLAKIK